METGGSGKGWETLALPFDVQTVTHSTRGEIIPFAAYKSGLSQKPFWLANFTVSGFKRSSAIQANEPYIIAMPNSSSYNNNYNLAGSVTFSSKCTSTTAPMIWDIFPLICSDIYILTLISSQKIEPPKI